MIQSHINYCTTTWLHVNRVIANKIQKICDKFHKMLYIDFQNVQLESRIHCIAAIV